jgi:hypothetical protein
VKYLAVGHILPEDTHLFRVTEAGWYVFDDDHLILLGPFDCREQCERATRQSMAT